MPTPSTWPAAAADLARRVTRRERLGALLATSGLTLGVGAVAALAGRLFVATPPVLGLLAGGLAVGVVVGAVRALRVRPVAPAEAAWALDRRADARGRGLVAAVVPGAVGAEAAWAEPRIAPPPVRLRPAPGLPLAAGACLLAAMALVVPGRDAAAVAPIPSAESDAEGASARGGAAAEDAAGAEAAKARVAEEVREALGLTRESAADPRLVAERLRDPDTRRAAEQAAAGTSLAEVVGDDATDAEDLARALLGGAASEETARRMRRETAGAEAHAGATPIPPARRALVERWLALVPPGEGRVEDSR